jgi:hypothetical protein
LRRLNREVEIELPNQENLDLGGAGSGFADLNKNYKMKASPISHRLKLISTVPPWRLTVKVVTNIV